MKIKFKLEVNSQNIKQIYFSTKASQVLDYDGESYGQAGTNVSI